MIINNLKLYVVKFEGDGSIKTMNYLNSCTVDGNTS